MNVKIDVSSRAIGNARVGYHNTLTTVIFQYPSYGWIPEREREVVLGIVPESMNMWHDAKMVKETQYPTGAIDRVWEVRHGFDSGD